MKLNKVLLVDDSEADQYLTQIVVQDYNPNIEFLVASDGREALDMLAAMDAYPDLVLLDINMPGLNGYNFLDEYSQLDNQSAIVVMLSSSSQTSDKERCLSYECVVDYFIKPLTKEDLERLEEK